MNKEGRQKKERGIKKVRRRTGQGGKMNIYYYKIIKLVVNKNSNKKLIL